MPFYRYRGVDATGRVVTGELEALNPMELRTQLAQGQITLLSARAQRQRSSMRRQKLTPQEKLDLMYHLQMLLQAGVSIVDALDDLRSSDSVNLRRTGGILLSRINAGESLAQAMRADPDNFDSVVVSLVHAGEGTGALPEVLERIVDSMRWQIELASQLKKALAYPAFVGITVSGVVVFLMVYLVPQLVVFIQSAGQDLPMHTRLLIAVSDAFVHYWWAILGTPPTLFGLVNLAARQNQKFRGWLQGVLLKSPLIGPLVHKIVVARLLDIFGLMYRTGVPIIQGLDHCIEVTQNLPIQEATARVRDRIVTGIGITDAFAAESVFPSIVIRMLRVGEMTGAIDQALENVTRFFNREVRDSVNRIQSLLEPIITVILGLILGWIMLAVLGPIYDTITKIV